MESKQPCPGCQHARRGGCTLPEDALDHRGEPVVGQPLECRYFVLEKDPA